jgi:anti-anti-sigma regulatory factor
MANAIGASPQQDPGFSLGTDADAGVVALRGVLSIRTVSRLEPALGALPQADTTLDLSGVTTLDTAGAWSLARL